MQSTLLRDATLLAFCFGLSLHLQGCSMKSNNSVCKDSKLESCDGDAEWCQQKELACTGTKFGCGDDDDNAVDANSGWITEGDDIKCCPGNLWKCDGDKDLCTKLMKEKECKEDQKPDAADDKKSSSSLVEESTEPSHQDKAASLEKPQKVAVSVTRNSIVKEHANTLAKPTDEKRAHAAIEEEDVHTRFAKGQAQLAEVLQGYDSLLKDSETLSANINSVLAQPGRSLADKTEDEKFAVLEKQTFDIVQWFHQLKALREERKQLKAKKELADAQVQGAGTALSVTDNQTVQAVE